MEAPSLNKPPLSAPALRPWMVALPWLLFVGAAVCTLGLYLDGQQQSSDHQAILQTLRSQLEQKDQTIAKAGTSARVLEEKIKSLTEANEAYQVAAEQIEKERSAAAPSASAQKPRRRIILPSGDQTIAKAGNAAIVLQSRPPVPLASKASILVIDENRLQAIVRQLARRGPIELLLGQGVEDGNGITYLLKLPNERPDGKTPVVEGIKIIYRDGVAEDVQCFLTGFPDRPWTSYKPLNNPAEQSGTDQPATAPKPKPEGDQIVKPVSEVRPQ